MLKLHFKWIKLLLLWPNCSTCALIPQKTKSREREKKTTWTSLTLRQLRAHAPPPRRSDSENKSLIHDFWRAPLFNERTFQRKLSDYRWNVARRIAIWTLASVWPYGKIQSEQTRSDKLRNSVVCPHWGEVRCGGWNVGAPRHFTFPSDGVQLLLWVTTKCKYQNFVTQRWCRQLKYAV